MTNRNLRYESSFPGLEQLYLGERRLCDYTCGNKAF